MTPATVLPVEPGDCVLDLCAAPGGKSTALAAKLRGKGLLVANDISASRAKALLKNLEVFGVKNSFVTNAVVTKLEEQFGMSFNKILVDAPCSGEGMFRKDIANARAWSMERVETCSNIQRDILVRAAHMLVPGGWMVYSTCTFSPEENEQVIAHLLRECPEMQLMDVPWQEGFSHGRPELCRSNWWDPAVQAQETSAEDGPSDITKCVRIFPHKMGGEGHFLALLYKKPAQESVETDMEKHRTVSGYQGDMPEIEKAPEENTDWKAAFRNERKGKKAGKTFSRQGSGKNGRSSSKAAAGSSDWEALEEFFRDVTMEYDPNRIEVRNDQVYLVPVLPRQVSGIPFLRNGLYLGEIRKDRFEPSQSFAMALTGTEYASVVDFKWTDERVYRYLKGETVDLTEEDPAAGIRLLNRGPSRQKGWQLICVDGYPLGWAKLVNGTLKNKYHSGWRMQN